MANRPGVPYGDSELDRLLYQTFGRRGRHPTAVPKGPRSREVPGLGDYDYSMVNTEGLAPGLMYAEGPQTQKGGMRGKMAHLFSDDIDPKKCPEWMTGDCLNLISRLLEDTFRNFQQTSRMPSHINPPFSAEPIDVFPNAPVNIPAIPTGPPSFTTVTCFTVPATRFRAEVAFAGQSAESAAAFSDLEWRVTVDGAPKHPYEAFRIQLWKMVDPTPLCVPFHLVSNQTICIEARSLSATPHNVLGRLCGWFYPVRTETGREIRSTLVD